MGGPIPDARLQELLRGEDDLMVRSHLQTLGEMDGDERQMYMGKNILHLTDAVGVMQEQLFELNVKVEALARPWWSVPLRSIAAITSGVVVGVVAVLRGS